MATLQLDRIQLQNRGKISKVSPFLQWLKVTTTKTQWKSFSPHSTESTSQMETKPVFKDNKML